MSPVLSTAESAGVPGVENDLLRKAEWAVAILLTLAAVCLHLINATSAGGLWRDEAFTVDLATLPGIGDIWNNLAGESFPMLWHLIVRGVSMVVGPMNDPAFRALGGAVGLSVVAAIWLYARTLRQSCPIVSLALLGLSPTMIRWGDSMRAWGFGILLILLAAAQLWRFVDKPNSTRFIVAAIAAIAAVNALYYNALLLLAFCAGAVAVCVRKRHWNTAALVVSIGALAAVSLLPYVSAVHDAATWRMLVQIPDYTLGLFWLKLIETLRAGGFWAAVGWLEALVIAIAGGVAAICSTKKFCQTRAQKDVTLFSVVTLLVGVVAVFLFLKRLSYLTHPWYYLTLLALAGVCIDALLGVLILSRRARIGRLAGVLLLAGLTFPHGLRAVSERMTNVDLVAARLDSMAQPDDLVLVSPFYMGISFQRYYKGRTPWMTVPPLGSHGSSRFDLVKMDMMVPDQASPVRPVNEAVADVLRAGHRVFFVGGLELPPPGQAPTVLPAAPASKDGWYLHPYMEQWSIMVGFFVQQHAVNVIGVRVGTGENVNVYENLSLAVAEGWHP